MIQSKRTLLSLFLALALAVPNIASANQPQNKSFGIKKDEPIVLIADEMGYDTANHKVIARGNVGISQNLTVLLAKEVEYDEKNEIVIARGDVSVMEATSDVYFAEIFGGITGLHDSILCIDKCVKSDNIDDVLF